MSENPPSEVQRTDEERVYVLSRLAENSERGEAGILITDLAAGVWKRRWIIAAVTVFGGVVGLGLERMSPTLYRATATILIQPPQFSSELKPKALSIGGVQCLAERRLHDQSGQKDPGR